MNRTDSNCDLWSKPNCRMCSTIQQYRRKNFCRCPKTKKIIGTKPELVTQFAQYKGSVQVDLDSNKVVNGKTSIYSRTFLNKLINLEPIGIAYAAKLKIDMLIEFSKMLIELTKEPQIGAKAIELVKMDVSEDAYDLIIDIVAGFDPTALEIIKEEWL